jgi:hypothetical protein
MMDASTTNGRATEVDSDVDVIEPQGRSVQFRGQQVQIMPLTVGKIPAVTRALRGVRIGDTDAAGMLELVAEHGDQVLDAAALATGLPLSEIEAAELPEFVELFAVLLEVNAAFFTHAVHRLLGTLGAFGGGPMSSTDSSTQDTSSPT